MTALTEPRSSSASRDRPSRGRVAVWWPVVLGVVAGTVAAIGSGTPSFWGDEAASVMSAQRSWSSLAAMLQQVDAVHGLYYAFLHVWIQIAGTTEVAVRFPSAVAAGFAGAGVVVLGRRLFGLRIGVLAGAVLAITPGLTNLGMEARSYPFAIAAATWVTVLFVWLLSARRSTAAWIGYAVALAASAYLFEFVVFLVPVHLAFALALRARGALKRWAPAVAVTAALVAPLAVTAYFQRWQIGFLAHRDYGSPADVLVDQWFGTPVFAVVAWALLLVGIVPALRMRGAARRRMLAVASWALSPTAVLVAVNATVMHVYNERYLAFCLPAVAMLVALGIDRLLGIRHTVLRAASVVVVVLLMVGGAAPEYLAQRGPYAKAGNDLRQASAVIAARARPGDAIVFDQSVKNSWKPDVAVHLYPADFVGLDDVTLATDHRFTPGLWDRRLPVSDVASRLAQHDVVWAMEISGEPNDDLRQLEALGYSPTWSSRVHRTVIYRVERRSS